jgi:transcriptional regulator with XRE-family HTH domain
MSCFPLICERCFAVNDCQPELDFLPLEGGLIEHYIEWSCPAPDCAHLHRLRLKGEVEETIAAYNRHIRAIEAGLESARQSHSLEDEKEESEYGKRLEQAEKLDLQEGGCKHQTRVRFGYWFRRLRMSKWNGGRMSISAAARSMDISREHLSRIEMGEDGYSNELVLKMAMAVGATIEMACKMAGIEVPAQFLKKPSVDRLSEAREAYLEALEEEDVETFLVRAIIAHRSYHAARRGSNRIRVLDVPARPVAIGAAERGIAAIRALEKQDERISTFRAIALTSLLPQERYRWISELVVHVLSEEQRSELTEVLISFARRKKDEKGS